MSQVIAGGAGEVIITDPPSAESRKVSANTTIEIGQEPGAQPPPPPPGLTGAGAANQLAVFGAPTVLGSSAALARDPVTGQVIVNGAVVPVPHPLAGIPDADTLILWKLDEVAGSIVFANSAAVNPGQVLNLVAGGSGSPAVGVPMPWGSRAVRGRGINNQSFGYLESALVAPEPVFPITIDMWILPTTTAFITRILNKQGGGTLVFDFFMAARGPLNNADIAFNLANGGGFSSVSSGFPAASFPRGGADPWIPMHIGITYDGVDLLLYVNGILVSQAAGLGAIDYGAFGTRTWAVLGDGTANANNNFPGAQWWIHFSKIARPASYFEAVYAAGMGWAA